jgi:formamidopyrimidine-DNA glycosylase
MSTNCSPGLMKHRWNKGKKDSNVLPNGEKIIHLKVGGRTSAVVPSVQKKTGPVAGDVDLKTEINENESETDTPRKKKQTNGTKGTSTENPTPVSRSKGRKVKEEVESEIEAEVKSMAVSRKRKGVGEKPAVQTSAKKTKSVKELKPEPEDRRRSGRTGKT